MACQPFLELRHVDVHYGELQTLWDISLRIEEGQIVSVIGANGAGKSTLLKTIVGALAPSRGQVLHKSEKINHLKPYQTLARGIALVPEGRRIFPRLTVLENLLIGSYLSRARKQRLRALNKMFALFPVLEKRSNQLGTNLSGGEQQMLAIARAMMSNPMAILFDEISLGLSPLIIRSIYATIQEINRAGVMMLLVEQDVQRSLKTSSYAYVLQEGKVVLQGEQGELTAEDVKRAYFGG